jgi:hypothetical protein
MLIVRSGALHITRDVSAPDSNPMRSQTILGGLAIHENSLRILISKLLERNKNLQSFHCSKKSGFQ